MATVRAEDVPGSGLRAWTVALPAKVEAGQSRMITLRATVAGKNGRGIRVDDRSGHLLPGAGWFPRLEPETETVIAHATTFLLPEGASGVAAGELLGAADWQSAACRPYAVWGATKSGPEQGARGESVVAFDRWVRKAGAAGPTADQAASAVSSFDGVFGAAAGSGGWKLIDVGSGVLAGGARTVFYDSEAWGRAAGDALALRDRDLFGAVAASYWTEAIAFRGSLAAFLSQGITRYLGDVTYQAMLEDDAPHRTLVTRARRDAFVKGAAGDRALEGLVACAPGADFVLGTRGALVAHQMEAAVTSERPRWILLLTRFHGNTAGRPATAEDFRALLRDTAVAGDRSLLTTTDLPDLVLEFQERGKSKRVGIALRCGRGQPRPGGGPVQRRRLRRPRSGTPPRPAESGPRGDADGELRGSRAGRARVRGPGRDRSPAGRLR